MCDVSGREWELKVQEYEDEDEEEEPSVRTRVRSLLLILSLQLYHRLLKIRERLQKATRMLGDAASAVRQRCSVHSPAFIIILLLLLLSCSSARCR